MGSKIYVARYELNSVLDIKIATSVWMFCYRNISHAISMKADYTITVGGKVHQSCNFVNAYKISTILKMLKSRKNSDRHFKGLCISEYDEIVEALNTIKNPIKDCNEMA